VSYVDPNAVSPLSEPPLADTTHQPIRIELSAFIESDHYASPSGVNPALLDGFKEGIAALAPYSLEPHSGEESGSGKSSVCRAHVSTNYLQIKSGWRTTRLLLPWFSIGLIPFYDEEIDYLLTFELLEDKAMVKTGRYVLKEQYFQWLFAPVALAFFSGEWTLASEPKYGILSPSVRRLGVIVGRATTAFCSDSTRDEKKKIGQNT